MLDARTVLRYFIEYEKKTALMENTLSKVEGELFSDDHLSNTSTLKEYSFDKKVSTIFKKLTDYKDIKDQLKKRKYNDDELRSSIKLVVSGEMEVADFLSWIPFVYADNRLNTEEFIKNLLVDTTTICYPLLKKKTKQETTIKPLITFMCRFENQNLKVDSFFINRESLEIIIAKLTNCSTSEIAEIEKSNLQELLSANDYAQQTNMFEIINILNRELSSRYGKTLEHFKSYEGWQKLNQAFITFETLEEMTRPIFQKEIQRIIELVSEKVKFPELLSTYLIGGHSTVEYNNSEEGKLFHYGSYSGSYPINEKQWHTLDAAQNYTLLSVNGPPGTGKSTLLKEIFADNMVKKARGLIEVWEQPWERFKERSSELYRYPITGSERTYSMVLTSTNNKAVDNIGLELLKEVAYFSRFVTNEEENEQINGFFCARLGNATNKESFMKKFVPMFLKGLEAEYNQHPLPEVKTQFIDTYNKLEDMYGDIERFIEVREETVRFYTDNKITSISTAEDRSRFISEREESEKRVIELEISMNDLKDRHTDSEQNIRNLEKKVEETKLRLRVLPEEIKEGYSILEKYLRWKKGSWFGWLIPKRKVFFKEYPSETYIENRLIKNKETEEQELLNKRLPSSINDLNVQKSIALEIQEQLTDQEIEQLALTLKLQFLYKVIELLELQILKEQELSDKWELEETSLNSRFDFSCNPIILRKRHELYLLSLRVTEQYILQHAKEVIHNLNLICEGSWFNPFFNEGNKRDIQYAKGIQSLWDTMFLCFPVATSTLHSFGERTFHLLPQLIDTLLVDEAGQIMAHYLSSPLFRSRRAIIVGDIEQLEPIRLLKSNVIEQFQPIPETHHDTLCVQRNSAQSYVDLNSDIYECDYQGKRKGMILTEHRRCEESIMLFSNLYVYGNILTIINKDNHDKLFERNLVAIDVRGLKDRRAHSNLSEVQVCKNLVDAYVKEYGEDIKEQIGIITPFSKQKEKLQAAIAGVDIGTVHTFQGQEKKYIIFSSVIDTNTSKKQGLTAFIGGRSNMLNVALSRAKEQFVLVGNLDIISNLEHNYLQHVLRIIMEKGVGISPYDEQFHTVSPDMKAISFGLFTTPTDKMENENEVFSTYIREHIPQHLIITPEEHYQVLIEAMRYATKSIVIFSPWIMPYVVNEEFIDIVEAAMAKSVEIRIGFGYRGGKGIDIHDINSIVMKDYAFGRKSDIELSISKLKEVMGEALQYIPPIHSKILLVDDKYLFIGSHNWLSKIGKVSKRDEVSCLIVEDSMIQYLKERYIHIKLK
ncbi:AAA domain-containing protein [Paenibacillus sp. VTT E-133280]|uniref:AAA domain-containing protein n=1 Tax=Paenibacillus sp. VTT E-133280 TaxID=1986222 RepID=UPI0015C5F653|nr:AAA domain-containing protein [Paenibacillus sp. VTT E-133280]